MPLFLPDKHGVIRASLITVLQTLRASKDIVLSYIVVMIGQPSLENPSHALVLSNQKHLEKIIACQCLLHP